MDFDNSGNANGFFVFVGSCQMRGPIGTPEA